MFLQSQMVRKQRKRSVHVQIPKGTILAAACAIPLRCADATDLQQCQPPFSKSHEALNNLAVGPTSGPVRRCRVSRCRDGKRGGKPLLSRLRNAPPGLSPHNLLCFSVCVLKTRCHPEHRVEH